MRIVFDTNIICSDYWLKGTSFRALFQLIVDSSSTLHIPEVVLDELFKIYEEDVKKDINKVQSYASRILNTSFNLPTDDNSINDQLNLYHEFINGVIKKYKINTIPYPDVPLKEIIERELKGIKPFAKRDTHNKKSKTGSLRDFLIWQSVLNLVKSDGPEVVFIANNPDEFSVDKGQGREILHKDLLTDLNELGIDQSKLNYFLSLDVFVKKVVTSKLESIRTDDGFELHIGINLKDWIRKKISTMDIERKVDVHDDGYGFKHSDHAKDSYLNEIHSIDILSAKKLSESTLICEAIANCTIELLVGDSDELGFEYGDAVISFLLEIDTEKAEVTACSWEINPATHDNK